MLIFFIILLAAIVMHLASIAVTGRFIGVKVRVFSLGFGPTIFQSGAFRLGAIPAGGYVRFRNSIWETVPAEEMHSALDGRSTFEQLAILLSGCAVLVGLGIAAAGAAGLDAFLYTPRQILAGASSPFDEAQTLIRQSLVFLHAAPVGILVGTICTKLAALNLLPFPATNGAAAIAVIGRKLGIAKLWRPSASLLLILIYAALFASWCLAILVFACS